MDAVLSCAVGFGMGGGASAAAAAAAVLAARAFPPRSTMAAMARRTAMRMVGAATGVLAGVAIGPPSFGAFVFSFLVVFLAGNAVLVFRSRGAAKTSRS